MKYILLFTITLFSFSFFNLYGYTNITPGERWNDTNGVQINAHGGCVVFHEGAYY